MYRNFLRKNIASITNTFFSKKKDKLFSHPLLGFALGTFAVITSKKYLMIS